MLFRSYVTLTLERRLREVVLRNIQPASFDSEFVFPDGPKNVKFSGVGVPLWGEFNGEVENLPPNFSPPNYSTAEVGGGLDAGARPLLNFGSLGTCCLLYTSDAADE